MTMSTTPDRPLERPRECCCRREQRSSIPGQRHDLIGSQAYVAATAQMGDNAGPASAAGLAAGRPDPHRLAVEVELHFGVRHQPRLLADRSWNRDLAFGGDAHCFPRWIL